MKYRGKSLPTTGILLSGKVPVILSHLQMPHVDESSNDLTNFPTEFHNELSRTSQSFSGVTEETDHFDPNQHCYQDDFSPLLNTEQQQQSSQKRFLRTVDYGQTQVTQNLQPQTVQNERYSNQTYEHQEFEQQIQIEQQQHQRQFENRQFELQQMHHQSWLHRDSLEEQQSHQLASSQQASMHFVQSNEKVVDPLVESPEPLKASSLEKRNDHSQVGSSSDPTTPPTVQHLVIQSLF